jgi:hypothetical protein
MVNFSHSSFGTIILYPSGDCGMEQIHTMVAGILLQSCVLYSWLVFLSGMLRKCLGVAVQHAAAVLQRENYV